MSPTDMACLHNKAKLLSRMQLGLDLGADLKAHRPPGRCPMASSTTLQISWPC